MRLNILTINEKTNTLNKYFTFKQFLRHEIKNQESDF
jgi:hypothetical protein